MAATIRDIAKMANVSIGSVSNVLNGRNSVKASVRLRVHAAMEELEYKPHRRGQSLDQNRTTRLSFVLSNRALFDQFHSRILEGVSDHCDHAGYSVLFSKMQYASEREPGNIQLPPGLAARGSDCVILAGVNYPNLLKSIAKLDLPHVLLANNLIADTVYPAFDQVGFDDVSAAEDATRYLIEMGHRDIWYIGDTSLPWFKGRYLGYFQTMKEFGLVPRAQTAAIADDHFLNGLRCTASILEAKAPLTAIFAGTDDVAYGCWELLQQRGISVPADVSLLGFDDQRGPYKGLGLSSVRVEAERIGFELARMAIQKARYPEELIPEVKIATKLIKRGTCEPPRSC